MKDRKMYDSAKYEFDASGLKDLLKSLQKQLNYLEKRVNELETHLDDIAEDIIKLLGRG